jgi:hypothetical protein
MTLPGKKATVLHWIVLLGVMVAMAAFFIASPKNEVAKGLKGEWQLDFLEQNYLEAQKEQLGMEIIARKIVLDSFSQVAQGQVSSDCGFVGEIPLWNNGDTWCFPKVQAELSAKAKIKLQQELPEYDFTIEVLPARIVGTSKIRNVTSKIGVYRYIPTFSFPIEFTEFSLATQNAKVVRGACQEDVNLANCLGSNLPAEWNIGGCGENQAITSREVVFCANNKYLFAVDFTSDEGFAITGIALAVGDEFTITFSQDDSDSYKIYVTDYTFLANREGQVAELKRTLLSGFNWEEVELTAFTNCGEAPSKCNGEVTAKVRKDIIQTTRSTLLFAVTGLKDGKESPIKSWAST